MTFDMHDPSDNPYLPILFQNTVLNLDPHDLNFMLPLPAGPGLIDGGAPVMSAAGREHDDEDSLIDDMDDNSSEALVPVEDHDFPSYFVEYGSPRRLFHSHGTYSLPVDGDEMKREEAQHILLRKVIGSNHDAPTVRELLDHNPKERKVVDLCAGTGLWVLDMARDFPLVEFRGIDLVPIQTRYPPDNVRFEIADVTERLRFADASVDVVHARMTCLRADMVPRVLNEVARILRPGGLFLSAEWGVCPTLHPEHPSFAQHEAYIPGTISFYNAASALVPTPAPRIPQLISLTGSFEEPVTRRRAIPMSAPYAPYPSDAAPSHDLQFVSRVMRRIMQGYADALVAGGSVWHGDADAFKDELEQIDGIVCVYQTVCARKAAIN